MGWNNYRALETGLAEPQRLCRFCAISVVLVAHISGVARSEEHGGAAAKTPEWIWAVEQRSPQQKVLLHRTFRLSGRAGSAQLRVAAVFSSCKVRLNDRAIVAIDPYAPRLDLDVTDHLRTGENAIEIFAVSGDGPAELAASLQIELTDGSRVLVETGTDWSARSNDVGSSDQSGDRTAAVSFGHVAPEMWAGAARVTSFDDYTQWKQASDAGQGTDPATFRVPPGYQIELLRSAEEDESSWVSMAFDPKGRLTIAREDMGLLRLTLSGDRRRVALVETINDTLLECRGLLYAYGSLYANANNSKGLYRLRDTTGDDRFDDVRLLRKFPGNVGHGRNDLALGPDGMIYSIHGDAVQVPTQDVFDRTSPFREARRGQPTTEGCLIRTDRDGTRWELVASGLRNPYGVDFNAQGEAFTYDADAEHDMGAPWYRPTRIVHLVSGADFGWRGRTGDWPPYDPDHADNALPVVDIGKGSPTAVKSGRTSGFPAPYRDVMFALDWTYGRILACHLQPRGAGYVCRAETFLTGRPFNVTDLTFGPDGAMYVVTGGRKTQSALYRIQYVAKAAKVAAEPSQPTARDRFSRKQRELRQHLAMFHGRQDAAAVRTAWPHLASPDPTIRHAARVAIEHQPVDEWQERALGEQQPDIAVTALLALARSGEGAFVPAILRRLNELPIDSLSTYQKLSLLHTYSICLGDDQSTQMRPEPLARLGNWLPEAGSAAAPVGAGHGVNRQLAGLLLRLGSAHAVGPAVSLLNQSDTQEDRLHYLFALRHADKGWTESDRRSYFEALADLERTVLGGAGMPGFLQRIREEATATLTDNERRELGDLLKPGNETEPIALTIDRPFVREWTVMDLTAPHGDAPRNLNRGRDLFREALCSHCHRSGQLGGWSGPDLTSVASRFGRRDLLVSILTPSLVVAEKYRNVQVVTTDGRQITGRVITGGDYRSPNLRIATDALSPSRTIEIAKADIDTHQLSPVSPMPNGLLHRFSKDEILDLLAYIESGGQP